MVAPGNKRIARNTFFLYFRMCFVLLITLYTSRVILNTLGVVDYGIYNVVAGFVLMFSFLRTSLVGAIQRYYNYEGAQKGAEGIQQVFEVSIGIQIVLSIAVFVVLETFGIWYINNVMVIPPERLTAANYIFQFSIISLVVIMIEVPFSSAVVSFEKMNFFAIVGVIEAVIKLLITLIIVYISVDKLVIYGLLMLLLQITIFVLFFFYCKIHFKDLVIRQRFNKDLLKSMMIFSGWNFFGTFSNAFYSQGVNLILNFFYGPVLNASRGIANQIKGALQGFSVNALLAFRPQLVESYASGDFKRTRSIMFGEAKACYYMLLILIVPIILEINQILAIWLGAEIVPEYTVSFSVLILVDMLISSCNAPFTQVTHASGNMKNFQVITGILTCINIPLSYLCLKSGMPPTSVFWVSIIIGVLSQVACILIVRRFFEYSIREYLIKVLGPCILVTIIAPIIPLAIRFVMSESFFRLILVVMTSCLCTSLLFYFIVLSRGEKELVVDMVRNVFNRLLNKKSI